MNPSKTSQNVCRLIGLLLTGVFASSLAQGQEVLSFNQCVDLAKQNNADLRSSEESLNASRFQVDGYRGYYYPTLTGNLGYSHSGPDSESMGSVESTSYTANLTLSQNIFNGFADVARVDSAKAQVRSSEASLQITKAKVSYDLKSAFANLLYAKDAEKISREILKRREDNLRMVQLRFENGRENKGSLLLSQAYQKQATVDVMKAMNRHETSSADLQKVLGMNSDHVMDIQETLPMREPGANPDFKALAIINPDRSVSEAAVGTSEAAVKSAKSGFYPVLGVSGQVGKLSDRFFPDDDRWLIAATMSWPLFGGGRDYYATKAAAANLYAAKSNLLSVERQLYSTLKSTYTSYVEAVEDLKVNDAFLTAAKARAEIARSKYNNGLMTFDEWDIIENDLITKTKNYLISKRDRIIAEAAWEQAQGTGVIP